MEINKVEREDSPHRLDLLSNILCQEELFPFNVFHGDQRISTRLTGNKCVKYTSEYFEDNKNTILFIDVEAFSALKELLDRSTEFCTARFLHFELVVDTLEATISTTFTYTQRPKYFILSVGQ